MDETEAYALAVGLLARREHSSLELRHKLAAKGVGAEWIAPLIERLIAERLQSDERYTDVYIRQRANKGYGPLRIRMELRERGIDDGLISAGFRRAESEDGLDWHALAAEVYRKKYGEDAVDGVKERAKRLRFMQYRGFGQEQIATAMGNEN